MPYETGAKVKLTRDVQLTANDTAARIGFPGPLCLAEGLQGIVTGSARKPAAWPRTGSRNSNGESAASSSMATRPA